MDVMPSAPVRRSTTAAPFAVVTRPAARLDADIPLAVVAAQHMPALTPAQVESLIQLNESFLAEIPEPAVDQPPESTRGDVSAIKHERSWRDVQRESDERFKSLFGFTAFNAMQLKRARDASAETAPAGSSTGP
jgi:hypothetical protein